MGTTTEAPPVEGAPTGPLAAHGSGRGDAVFAGISRVAGSLVLVIMAGIAVFLVAKSIPALQANTANFFTYQQWFPDDSPSKFGIAALVFGTVLTAVIAMVLAVPVGYGIALFITHYAGRTVASVLAFVVDLLAAVPSIIFGMWGLQYLMPRLTGLQVWLTDHLSFIPLFQNDQGIYGKSIFVASIVLALMILPTVSAISREVFAQTPHSHIEASLALGATKWEMVRTSIIPFSRPGMISAAMLGLGRALGETIAVALILSAAFDINWQITEPAGNSIAANIALKFNEAGDIGVGALIASGLVLFVITLVVNSAARLVIARRAAFSGAN